MKKKKSITMIVGNNIKKYRENIGLDQESLANLCNILPSYLNSIEQGKIDISIDLIEQIAKELNIPIPKLFQED